MAGVDYCTVLPSWEFDKDPACVVSYLFDSIDGYSEASATAYVPPNSFMNSCLTLECSSNDQLTGDSREPCTLSITSKPQYRVSVLGVDIICQSRSLEVYDACEGYMMTSRGKRIPCLDAEGGENQSDMFSCRVRLKETLFGFTVKFPSTSNMKKFNIYNIVVILNPETEDDGNVEVAPTFNMDKVRSFVDTDSMSPGAQQLMRSVEQFQQNKKSAVSASLQGMFGQSVSRSSGSPSGGPGMMGLMGLMSMFSGMSSAGQPGSRDTPTGPNSTQPNQADSRGIPQANNSLAASQSNARNIPQAINRTEKDSRSDSHALNKSVEEHQFNSGTATRQMRETSLQTDSTTNSQANTHEVLPPSLNFSELRNAVVGSSSLNSGVPSESEETDMYQMLQNICGRVSQMRTVEKDLEESRAGMETKIEERHADNPQRHVGDTGEAEGQSSLDDTDGGQGLASGTLRTVVKGCIEEFELRLQTHIDNRLSQIEEKLEAKLDSILGVLQTLKGDNSTTPTHVPNSHTDRLAGEPTGKVTHRATKLHAEGTTSEKVTHIPTEGATMLHTEGATHMLTGRTTHIHTNGNTHVNTEAALHKPSEMATYVDTDGNPHLPTHRQTCTPTLPDGGNGKSTHRQTETSAKEVRNQPPGTPRNSLVMDDESGENS